MYNCSQSEFETKVAAKHPNIILYITLLNPQMPLTIYAYKKDPYSQYNSWDHLQRSFAADYVWQDGTVLIDTDGLFSVAVNVPGLTSFTIGNGTITTISDWADAMIYTEMFGGGGAGSGTPKKLPTCECGAHSTGSNKHSSWCQLKEIE